jgi:hypothetical protein
MVVGLRLSVQETPDLNLIFHTSILTITVTS